MTTLVLGASGATGRLLVGQLLERGLSVRAIVRPGARLPDSLEQHPRLDIVRANLLDLGDDELARQVHGCTAIASCLGHTLSLKGIFGAPRRLVTEATRRLCAAVRANAPPHPVRFVLMNTAGNRGPGEPVSFVQRCALGLIRLLLPPHADNELAADHLHRRLGRDDGAIEWVVLRPDTLLDAAQLSPYETHPAPTRSAIFDPGQTSRINVAHFMAELIADDDAWSRWKGRMPVIYNQE